MAAMGAAEDSASHKAQKREREDVRSQESEDNQQKRSRHSLLSEFIFDEAVDTSDSIQDETILHIMQSLEEEISRTPEVSEDKVEVGRKEISIANYDYLVSATDDELGIPPSPPAPLQENDGQHIFQNLWNDLFDNSSDQKVDLLQPFLTHCYSNNYRDFDGYSSDFPDSDGEKWFVDEASTDSVLQECMTLF